MGNNRFTIGKTCISKPCQCLMLHPTTEQKHAVSVLFLMKRVQSEYIGKIFKHFCCAGISIYGDTFPRFKYIIFHGHGILLIIVKPFFIDDVRMYSDRSQVSSHGISCLPKIRYMFFLFFYFHKQTI